MEVANFAVIWEFHVRADRVREFEEIYCGTGKWVELFRRDEAYKGTELLRDKRNRLRYLTVDGGSLRNRMSSFVESISLNMRLWTGFVKI